MEAIHRQGKDITTQTCCFISRYLPDAKVLLAAIRGHWQVPSGRENSLHGVLDIAFREDECQLRKGHAARTKLGMENNFL